MRYARQGIPKGFHEVYIKQTYLSYTNWLVLTSDNLEHGERTVYASETIF